MAFVYVPIKACTHVGCGALIPSKGPSKCEQHRVQAAQQYELSRGTRQSRGYDKDWDHIRESVLKRDEYLCQGECKKEGIYIPAKHVDHIIPFKGKDDPRRLDLSNLQALCVSCHSRKTAREDGGFGHRKKGA